jgi:hypothetical protein
MRSNNVVKTKDIQSYAKKNPGPMVIVKSWGLIVAGTLAIHKDQLENDLQAIIELTDGEFQKKMLATILKLPEVQAGVSDHLPGVIANFQKDQQAVEAQRTNLLYISGGPVGRSYLQVLMAGDAPTPERRLLLVNTEDLRVMNMPETLYVPVNGSMPFIADNEK